jgi:hypothetical protein
VRLNIRVGRIGQILSTGWGCCYRCDTPWRFVRYHVTNYGSGRGCFPLCEKCWTDLGSPYFRLPYYRLMFEDWARNGRPEVEWLEIQAAVLRGA